MLAHTSNTEKQLLLLVAKGDESAFNQLFYYYHHLVGRFAYKLTASKELSEEIVQDVFLKIWKNRESLADIRDFRAWLFMVAKNQCLNSLRQLIRERLLQQEWGKNQAGSIEPSPETTKNDPYALLDQAIRKLPPQQQKVFILSRYQRLKYDEIAHELNISKETVKSYLQIATSSITRFVTNRFFRVFWVSTYLFF